MSTELKDGTIVPGTKRDEGLLNMLAPTGRSIFVRARKWWRDLVEKESSFAQSHHERNVKTRVANRKARLRREVRHGGRATA